MRLVGIKFSFNCMFLCLLWVNACRLSLSAFMNLKRVIGIYINEDDLYIFFCFGNKSSQTFDFSQGSLYLYPFTIRKIIWAGGRG